MHPHLVEFNKITIEAYLAVGVSQVSLIIFFKCVFKCRPPLFIKKKWKHLIFSAQPWKHLLLTFITTTNNKNYAC